MSKLNEDAIVDLLDFQVDEDQMFIPSGSEFPDQEEDEENVLSKFDVPNYNTDKYNNNYYDNIMDWPLELCGK